MSVHTIHVPHGWSVEQTWEQITRGELVPERDGSWVSIEVEGFRSEGNRVAAGRLVGVLDDA